MQGGGTTGFSSIAYNLIANYAKRTGKKGKAAYAVTGSWSKKASEEAQRLGFDVNIVVNTKGENFGTIPHILNGNQLEKMFLICMCAIMKPCMESNSPIFGH